MYRQFNIQQFYVLPTQCIYVFCVDLRTNIFLCNQTVKNKTQCTYNVTLRRVRITIVAVEQQYI
jgi:hypothetical protein